MLEEEAGERHGEELTERRVIEKKRRKSRQERSRGDFRIEERKRENGREGAWVRGWNQERKACEREL